MHIHTHMHTHMHTHTHATTRTTTLRTDVHIDTPVWEPTPSIIEETWMWIDRDPAFPHLMLPAGKGCPGNLLIVGIFALFYLSRTSGSRKSHFTCKYRKE
jgi:hypothetical protein